MGLSLQGSPRLLWGAAHSAHAAPNPAVGDKCGNPCAGRSRRQWDGAPTTSSTFREQRCACSRLPWCFTVTPPRETVLHVHQPADSRLYVPHSSMTCKGLSINREYMIQWEMQVLSVSLIFILFPFLDHVIHNLQYEP